MINLLSRVLPKSMLISTGLVYASTKTAKFNFSTANLGQTHYTQQYAANSPIEDRVAFSKFETPGSFYFAVFDGHGGHLVADYASQSLHKILQHKLKHSGQAQDHVKNCITETFQQVEGNLLRAFKETRLPKMVTCGSCALVSLIVNKTLYVANAGDCEGILVKNDGSFISVNRRLNIAEDRQQQRLAKLFPNEKDLAVMSSNRACYLKGRLQPTFSLGDFYLKYKEYNVTGITTFTGPYVQHRPQISTFQISEDDKYLILATDGLWDQLDHKQVAHIAFSTQKSVLSKNLLNTALEKAASTFQISVEQLKKLRNRRNYHDDISFVIVDLKSLS